MVATYIFIFKECQLKMKVHLNQNLDQFFWILISLPSLYLIFNLFLKMGDLDIFNFARDYPDLGISNTLNFLFGSNVNRKPFPLSNGVNSFGTYVGCLSSITIGYFLYCKNSRLKKIAFLFFLVSMYCLCLLDTRMALIGIALTTIFGLILTAEQHLKLVHYSLIFIGILPILSVLTGFLLNNFEILSFLSRDSGDLTTGNNRNIIWLSCLNELQQVKLIHLFGFGQFGQVGSKVSGAYSDFFGKFQNPEFVSAHNNMLQLILDMGYIGLLFYLLLLLELSKTIQEMYAKTKTKNMLIFQNFIFYLALIGGTEAVLSHKSTFFLVLFLWVAIIFLRYHLSTFMGRKI